MKAAFLIIATSVALMACATVWADADSAQEAEMRTYENLLQRYKPPMLEGVGSDLRPRYQFFVAPEIVTEQVFPIVVTVNLTLDNLAKPTDGEVAVHSCKKSGTQLLGRRKLSAEALTKLLMTIGANEVLSLPARRNVRPWESFAALGGDRYTLVRLDGGGLRLVSRMAWECDPLANVAKEFMSYALPFFEK